MRLSLLLLTIFTLVCGDRVNAEDNTLQQYRDICLSWPSSMREATQTNLCDSSMQIIAEYKISDKVEKAIKKAKAECVNEHEECSDNEHIKYSIAKDALILALCKHDRFDESIDENWYSSVNQLVYRDAEIVARCDKNQLDQDYSFFDMMPTSQQNEYPQDNRNLLFSNLSSLLYQQKPKLFRHYLNKVKFADAKNTAAIFELFAIAANSDDEQYFQLIFDSIESYENLDNYYYQPLAVVIQAGKIDAAKKMLAANISANGVVDGRTSYLYEAVAKGDLELVNQLLAKGANINGKEFGLDRYFLKIPIANALTHKHFKIVDALLQQGAMIATTSEFDTSRSIMSSAIESGNIDYFNKLYGLGAKLPENLVNQLQRLIDGGNPQIFQRLFSFGLEIEPKDHYKVLSSFNSQLKQKNAVVVELLEIALDNGLSTISENGSGFESANSVLNLFSRGYLTNKYYNAEIDVAHKRYVKLVLNAIQLEKPVSLTEIKNKRTLLMSAARNGLVEATQQLIAAGVDKSLLYRDQTALDMAVSSRNNLAKKIDVPQSLLEEYEQVIKLLE